MEGNILLQLPEGMLLDQIQITEDGFIITVVATAATSCCPLCSQPSSSIHCRYNRTLRDVPCAGRRVQLLLTVRKFSCRNPFCERKVFSERLPTFVEPWARTTIRYHQQITSIGLATCGERWNWLCVRCSPMRIVMARLRPSGSPSTRTTAAVIAGSGTRPSTRCSDRAGRPWQVARCAGRICY